METTPAQLCEAVALRRQQNKLNLAISKNPWGLEVTCGAIKGVFFSTSELQVLGRLPCAAGKSVARSVCPELVGDSSRLGAAPGFVACLLRMGCGTSAVVGRVRHGAFQKWAPVGESKAGEGVQHPSCLAGKAQSPLGLQQREMSRWSQEKALGWQNARKKVRLQIPKGFLNIQG